jgi:hypothetical protein
MAKLVKKLRVRLFEAQAGQPPRVPGCHVDLEVALEVAYAPIYYIKLKITL